MNKEKKQNGQKFFKVPFFLLQREEYKSLSADAILLYALLLNRTYLSDRNPELFSDESGEIYVIFTIDEIQETLGCANKKAVRLLNNLEKAGLIEKSHGGITRASRIKVLKQHFDSVKNDISDSVKTTPHIVLEQHHSNTEYSNTYSSNTYHPFISVDEIQERVEYDIIKYGANAEIIAELIEVMAETYSVTSKEIRIGGTKYAADFVKSRLDKITSEHITDVAYKIANCNSKVKMTKNYMLRLLFDSPATIASETMITYHQSNYQ